MGFIDTNLAPDETLIYQTGVHWIVLLAPAILLALGLMSLSLELGGLLAVVFLAIGFVMFLRRIAFLVSTEYGLTNRRVLTKVGLIRRDICETELRKIEGANVNQGILGRLLNYGNVLVVGTGGRNNSFPIIKNPFLFRKKVQEQVAQLKSTFS